MKIGDNKVLIDKIGIDVSDEKFADFNHPAIVTILSKLSLSMSGQHKILSNVVSELEGVKMVISDIQNSIANPPATVDMSCFPPLPQSNAQQRIASGLTIVSVSGSYAPSGAFGVPVASGVSGHSSVHGISALNKRKPLKQAPLGSGADWNNVENRKTRKARKTAAPSQSEMDSECEYQAPPPQS